jgi:hypothetical protein
MKGDPVLDGMAVQLRDALVAAGLDHRNPPPGHPPPEKAFFEYQKRGGAVYKDPVMFVEALVAKVVLLP